MEKSNNDEENEWIENYRKQLIHEQEMMLSKHEATINEFTKHCLTIGIALDHTNFSFVSTIGVVCEYPDILTRLIPDLVQDKEGLLNWDSLSSLLDIKKINPGYLYANNFMAMASPVFRRGLHGVNNWAPRFIDIFWQLSTPEIDIYIGLDHDRVRINVDSSFCLEEDTWYGAPFNNDIAIIKDGVTHLRPPSDLDAHHLDFLFNGAYALDICWNTKDNIKSFQALEFKGNDATIIFKGQEFHPVRYIHAEYDLVKGEFRHFDGAIQYHTDEEYRVRKDSNFRHNIKDDSKVKPRSVKAFKFNGSISTEMWAEFSSHFFASNPLIHEYYSGAYPTHLTDTLHKIRANREQKNKPPTF